MRSARSLALSATALTLALLASCSSTSKPQSTQLKAEPSTSVPRPLMPDVRCLSLQDAQDLIQDQGVFYSRSEDASGQNRNQVVDSNWIVVDQVPEPGARFSEGDALLSVLKVDEADERGLC